MSDTNPDNYHTVILNKIYCSSCGQWYNHTIQTCPLCKTYTNLEKPELVNQYKYKCDGLEKDIAKLITEKINLQKELDKAKDEIKKLNSDLLTKAFDQIYVANTGNIINTLQNEVNHLRQIAYAKPIEK